MGAVTAMRPQGQGLFGNPGLLAAGAGGFASAALALWAMRDLPFGTGLFWAAPFPLFAAGLGFGPASAIAASLLGLLLVALAGGGHAAVIYLVLFAVPVPLLVLAGLRGGRIAPAAPLALLGLWPLVVLLAAAVLLADDGGLEAAMRQAIEASLLRLGIPAPEDFVSALVRVKAGAIGFWVAVVLLVNALAATGFLARRGLLAAPRPDWAAVRLPGWYPLLLALALGLFVAAPAESDAIPLSALLVLLVPLFLQGLAGVHRRLRGRAGRRPMLAAFYVLLVLFLQVMGPGLVGLGLYDQFQRRAAPRQT